MAEEMFEHSLAVGNVTQASISGLANGRSYRVAVTAYDGLGRESLPSESKIVSLISAVRNNIPVITSEPVRIAKEYHPYSYDVEAQDADNDSLIYQLITAPQGMNLDPETGLIQWIPARENAGNNYVEIIVDDGNGGIETQKYSVLVETEHFPPITTAIIDPPENMHGWNNSPVTVHLSATDGPDGTGVKNIFYKLNSF